MISIGKFKNNQIRRFLIDFNSFNQTNRDGILPKSILPAFRRKVFPNTESFQNFIYYDDKVVEKKVVFKIKKSKFKVNQIQIKNVVNYRF